MNPRGTIQDITSDSMKIFEPNMFEKKMIPKDFECNPMSDRTHYMQSPQFRHSCMRGDYNVNLYQSRTMNRRMNMRDSFTKVLPTYHHTPNSGYQQSYSHRAHREIKKYVEGNQLADKNLDHHHKKDFIKTYSESMWVLGKDFAPETRK